jgi:hypothetical protein
VPTSALLYHLKATSTSSNSRGNAVPKHTEMTLGRDGSDGRHGKGRGGGMRSAEIQRNNEGNGIDRMNTNGAKSEGGDEEVWEQYEDGKDYSNEYSYDDNQFGEQVYDPYESYNEGSNASKGSCTSIEDDPLKSCGLATSSSSSSSSSSTSFPFATSSSTEVDTRQRPFSPMKNMSPNRQHASSADPSLLARAPGVCRCTDVDVYKCIYICTYL